MESEEYNVPIPKPAKGTRYVGANEDERWWEDVDEKTDKKTIYNKLVENMGVFRWQSAHGFRIGQNRNVPNLKAKYKNIKQEALNNSYEPISKDNWNQILRKSKAFYQSWARHKIRTKYDGYFEDKITQQTATWKQNKEINMQEIVTYVMLIYFYHSFENK